MAPEIQSGEDLLAQREQEEFEASVRTARDRAAAGAARKEPPRFAADAADEEILWAEQSDVYRPRRIGARTFVASLALASTPRISAGQSVVLVRRSAYDTLVDHLRSDVTVELGGLLGGEALYDRDLDLFIVAVEVALPALNGDGTATSFSYTPAAWEAIMPGWQGMKSEWTLVGSYHSHPGMGVFLSPVDRTTQAEVFPHDWQVAMVVDPVAGAAGFFLGVSGKPCPFTIL